jgi:5'-3' exonuclease
MGIQNFTKLFPAQGEVKYKDLRGKWVAVDAMYQLHRMAHPFKTANGSNAVLTAPDGSMTNHINGLLALILNMHKNAINQVWVFDNPGAGHDSLKDIEVERRKSCRSVAKQKLQDLVEQPELFSDEEKIDPTNVITRGKYERAAFSLDIYMINDLKYILDCFGVAWIEAPPGFEAEQLAAHMTNHEVHGIFADAVLTPDPDCLLFGARQMIKNDKQKLFKFDLDSIYLEISAEPTQSVTKKTTKNVASVTPPRVINSSSSADNLIWIGIALGCDFAEKVPGIGPKTVIKKLSSIKWSDRQLAAFKYFKTPICPVALATTVVHKKEIPFSDNVRIVELFKWLTGTKGFNATRMESRFRAAKLPMK